ncbi:MAG: DUF1295 domain-containing protein [Bacteroidia bacterium]|nr:DUF1295 domain-containing protein [Bacteroidia bacterium]
MELYGQQSRSIPQKILIHVLEILLIGLSYWILFQTGGNWLQEHLGITNAAGAEERRWMIVIFNLIIFLRMAFMMAFLLRRKIPWEESISVPMAFAIYFVGFPLFVLPESIPLSLADLPAILIFAAGCVINTGSELLRDRWKKRPENKGKIYTGGFFRYSQHVNYFGDLLWVIGYALMTRNWYSVTIPVFLFSFFAFYNIPKLDLYLKEKYGEEFEEYARKTKKFIPFLY